MKTRSEAIVRWLALFAVVAFASACAAAAAGAGAAAGIAYTQRGVSSQVNASVDELVASTEAAFDAMGIELTDREREDNEAELYGDDGEVEVEVHIDRDADDDLTEITVIAIEDEVQPVQDYARELLEEILTRT